jgi:histidyl-tRNA synthetase
LQKSLKGNLNKLCADCQKRFKANILRILDCKNEACQQVVKKLDIQDTYLCSDCRQHFTQVKDGLNTLKIDYTVTPYLVRGLDYYTRTVFEVAHKDLGAQDALGAGGRYDNLVKELDGPDVGAIGFAFGVERLLLATKPPSHQTTRTNLTYLITLGEEAKKKGLELLDYLRKNSIACDTDYAGKSLKGAMRRANDLGAKFVLIFGEDEIKNNFLTLKDMSSGTQEQVQSSGIIQNIKNRIA